MEEKKICLLSEEDIDAKVTDFMNELDIEETQILLEGYSIDCLHLDKEYVQDIKERVALKVGMNKSTEKDIAIEKDRSIYEEVQGKRKELKDSRGKGSKKKNARWKVYAASAAVILVCLFAWKNSDSIVHAFSKMFGLIPGVGIVEDNQDILYQLKQCESVETDQGILKVLSAVATKDCITVNFSFERKNCTEEQFMLEKEEEWERIKKEDKLVEPNIYLMVDNEKYKMSGGSSAGGLTSYFSATFELEEKNIHPSKVYTLQYEDFDITADFQLVTLDQYNSLDQIGATGIHNNISLTAISSIASNQLQVNVYPINHSEYNLISFYNEYEMEYFGKKLTLKTENGNKDYTLPGSYGSDLNAAYTFDISDGSKEFLLHIPFVVVESNEEEKITLPIPKEGEVVEINKEIAFKNGSVMIESVEKIVSEQENEYGHLKVNLKYKNPNENQQLVGVKLTRRKSEGWFEEFDEQGRIKAINYMLEKSDNGALKLYVVHPRYVFMDEYNLTLD
ncbi:hypothetical protein [Geosporobacter ferrireducens]|uniref:hypothetical protein n=1 Tax=Geosporobacter ferrireducens TaxID=1424294 RepID=UPI00139B6882|nr:hypothetical protein [Geosporobacter ferrireducens]MTI53639.1 hypothetical protein [Geosporobacter ferrireducens]